VRKACGVLFLPFSVLQMVRCFLGFAFRFDGGGTGDTRGGLTSCLALGHRLYHSFPRGVVIEKSLEWYQVFLCVLLKNCVRVQDVILGGLEPKDVVGVAAVEYLIGRIRRKAATMA
jgi:hypothetical protein